MFHTVIFDWKRTLYDPDTKDLIQGAKELLSFLHDRDIRLVLIGHGGEDMNEEVDKLGVRGFFDEIQFVDGKDISQFEVFVGKEHPEQTVVIGDRAQGELAIGKQLGATTVWIHQGKFANESPFPGLEPDREFSSLGSLNAALGIQVEREITLQDIPPTSKEIR